MTEAPLGEGTSGEDSSLRAEGQFTKISWRVTRRGRKNITYVNGTSLMIANSDGTNSRLLRGMPGIDEVSAPSWSADGKWILAPVGASLVRVADGAVLPLPFATSYGQTALH